MLARKYGKIWASYIAGGNVKAMATLENNLQFLKKIKHQPSNSTPKKNESDVTIPRLVHTYSQQHYPL